jgi:ferredoxin
MSETEVPHEAPELSLLEFRRGEAAGVAARRPDGEAGGDPRTIETELRRFCLGGPEAQEGESAVGHVPAALYPWLAGGRIRGDYPLFLGVPEDSPAVAPLAAMLDSAVERLGHEGEARQTIERMARLLERQVGSHLAGAEGPLDAGPLLASLGRELLESQPVSDEEREPLREALGALLAELPGGGFLVGYSEHAAIHLLLVSARRRLEARRAVYVREAKELASRVKGLLRADAARGDDADPEGLTGRVGTAAAPHLDASRFAEVTRHRHRAPGLGEERRRRLEDAVERLESVDWEAEPALILLHDGSHGEIPVGAIGGYEQLTAENPCAEAVEVFARRARRHLDLFRASRVARLELAGRLDPTRHFAALEALGIDGLREEELGVLPVVAALDDHERVSRREAAPLTRLLLSGWPVQLLVTVEPGRVPFLTRSDSHEERLELAYLGLAHRNAFVQQSAAVRPEHLAQGFLSALAHPRPGLHVLARGAGGTIDAEAALESRAHPFFRYDPDAGRTWAGRMDFSGNPDPDADWVLRRVPVSATRDAGADADEPASIETLEVRFTFADYALLDTDLDAHFRPIPEACPQEPLVTVAEYLELGGDDQLRRIPYVLGVDGSGVLRKLAVTRRLVRVAERRLDFWWTLRELAGVRNAYVEEAVRLAREEVAAEAAATREQADAAHAEELERAKREAVEHAISNVVRGLLDPGSLTEGGEAGVLPMPSVAPPAAPAAVPGEPAAPAARPEKEAPWIESVLCTSCNDCINLNPQLFVYDANKQAKIGDPTKGTYAQLVKAAEKCPSRCIHPGTPLNPNEPKLEALLKRAEPFR